MVSFRLVSQDECNFSILGWKDASLYFLRWIGSMTPVAERIFEAKIERYFLESFFLERNYCP